MEWEYHQDGITIPSRWFDNTILMELTESGRWSKSRGRGAHYVPRVKVSSKREVAFSLVHLCIELVHRSLRKRHRVFGTKT